MGNPSLNKREEQDESEELMIAEWSSTNFSCTRSNYK